jgi:hypothetical protein
MRGLYAPSQASCLHASWMIHPRCRPERSEGPACPGKSRSLAALGTTDQASGFDRRNAGSSNTNRRLQLAAHQRVARVEFGVDRVVALGALQAFHGAVEELELAHDEVLADDEACICPSSTSASLVRLLAGLEVLGDLVAASSSMAAAACTTAPLVQAVT